MHILSPETDNCPSWISGRERVTVENISWSISMKECCRPRWGLNPGPPGLQWDGASNWATEAGWSWYKISCWSNWEIQIRKTVYYVYPKFNRLTARTLLLLSFGRYMCNRTFVWSVVDFWDNLIKYLTLTTFWVCSVNLLLLLSFIIEISVFKAKCRAGSDATECGIWSGSRLFANVPLICLCWGFTVQSTQWGHVERGQFT